MKQFTRHFGMLVFTAMLALVAAISPLAADDDVEVEGVIESVTADNITVAGTVFLIDSDTEIELPFSNVALQAGLYAEVEGENNSSGILVADKIEVEDDVDLEGLIDSLGTDYVIVNGLWAAVDVNTEIRGDHGSNLTLSDLNAGDFVELRADLLSNLTYLATRIELEDDSTNEDLEVKGFITSLGQDSIVVNNITFSVDSLTRVEDDDHQVISFSTLQIGQFVEVHAIQRNGGYYATKIELEDDDNNNDLEIKDFITAIGADSLVVGNTTFVVDSLTRVEDDDNNPISFSALQVGQFVEVHAILRSNGYYATRIELEDDINGDEVEFTAPIDTLLLDQLIVGGQLFNVNAQTVILDDNRLPITFADLQIGMIVEIKGRRQPDGSLLATLIKIEDFFQDEIEVKAIIDSLGSDYIALAGHVFNVNAQTAVFNNQNLPIAFSDLTVGQIVEVRGDRLPNGSLLATRIKIEDQLNGNLTVFDDISGLSANQLTISGQDVNLDNFTLVLNHANDPINVSNINIGDEISLKAVAVSGTWKAVSVKIERQPGFGKLQGTVGQNAAQSVMIAGQVFAINTDTRILDEKYRPVSSAAILSGEEAIVWSQNNGNDNVALQIQVNAQNLTAIDNPQTNLPEAFVLKQNYPNPFNPVTTIPLTINGEQWQQVTLVIYNVLGQEINTLFNGFLNEGQYQFTWNANDRSNRIVPSGVYFYRAIIGSTVSETKKMILLR